MKVRINLFFLACFLFAASFGTAEAQYIVDTTSLHENVEFLSGKECDGRKSGTSGAFVCASWIAGQFELAGLEKMGDSWFHGFDMSGIVGCNVVGMRRGWFDTSNYIVIASHFDGIGSLQGKIYPGADSNASGIAALVALLHLTSRFPAVNVIFVALDGYTHSFAGAEQLAKELASENIRLMVNMDILGSSLAPLSDGSSDYLIALGGEKFSFEMDTFNYDGLNISFDYYSSRNFTELFYNRIGDQLPFIKKSIPAVVFTSGITMNTNKQTDTPESLDYPVFLKRIRFIARWLDNRTKW